MAKIGAPPEREFNPIDANVLAALSGSPSDDGAPPPENETPDQLRMDGLPNREPGERLPQDVVPSLATRADTAFNRVRRFKVSEEEDIAIDRAVGRLSEALSAKVGFSHVSRCLWRIFLTHEANIVELAKKVGGTSIRPANGDDVATREFEQMMGNVFEEAFASLKRRSPL